MRNSTMFFMCLISLAQIVYSQEQKDKSLYLELLGNGGLYSINFESNLVGPLNSRIGFSYFGGLFGDSYFTLPIMLNYFNSDDSFSPEIGIGIVPAHVKQSFITEKKEDRVVIYSATFGLRFHIAEKGLFRIGYTPLYSPSTKTIVHSRGFSFGVRF